MSRSPLEGIDAGLIARFRAAAAEIAWRRAAPSQTRGGAKARTNRPSPRARVGRLHEEEARVEERGRGSAAAWVVESGPVGALLLLVEIDRRGTLPRLTTIPAGGDPGFPSGAVHALWAGGSGSTVGVRDLVEVARYALP